MKNDHYLKAHMAKALLKQAHPLIRQTLMIDSEFIANYGLKTNFVISFSGSGISIQRSKLFNAIRKLLSGNSNIKVDDIDGRAWELLLVQKDGELPAISISCDDQRHSLQDFCALSSDSDIRLRSLEESASAVNLPADAKNMWNKILSKRILKDEEVDEFHRDFRYTPMHVAQSIRNEIESGESSITSLVPSSRRYFERLIGAYDGSTSIKDYAVGCAKKLIDKLFEWRSHDGFNFSLLLSSHSALTAKICVDNLGAEDLIQAYNYIEIYGDKISQLGAIEVGLPLLPERSEIEPFLIRIIKQIRDDKVEGPGSQFELFSALFVLVDGELSINRVLSNTPPFYRRLASLSHAALIHRQIVSLGNIDINSFSEWAQKIRAEQFYFQNLADMRLEPRWNPDLSVASQMKADFFGRIMISAENHKEKLSGSEIYKLILGTGPKSLLSLSKFPLPYLPGPLEGEEETLNYLPANLAEAVEKQLNAEEVGPSSFIALVNTALVFRMDIRQAELAAKALKLGNHRLANIDDRLQLLIILNGLATVAAVTRSKILADELKILIRKYRIDPAYRLSVVEAMRICLVAAASRADLNEWSKFLGDWITELAFGEFQNNEGENFHSHLQCLLHSVPDLWVSCGKAEAALIAYNKSMCNG